MFDLLFQIVTVLFGICIIAESISWVKLWEDHEYSLRRFIIFLKETKSGRKLIYGPIAIVKWAIIFSYFITIFLQGSDEYYHITVFILYAFLFLGILKNFFEKEISLPKINFSNFLVLFVTFFAEFALFIFAPLDHFLWIILIEKIMPVILAFTLLLLATFFDFRKDAVINHALRKIGTNKKLLSIAVVGSYGRGSTKEFITRVLSSKYNVLATKTSFSSASGIATTILSDLNQKKQIFVAELDDYNKTDIVQMCGLIAPKIIVLTGINEQKLSRFGSVEKIIESKREAINSLASDGVGIFNGDNVYSQKLFAHTKKKKFAYGTLNASYVNILATNIRESKFSVSFDVLVLGRKYSFSDVKLLGRQNIENLLPAIFIGTYMGIDFALIRKAIASIRPLKNAMEPKLASNGTVIVNDTHNANINSVQKVLSYIKIYKGKKILILEPLVELGKNASLVHKSLGNDIAQVCDYLILTNSNYFEAIRSGAKSGNASCSVKVLSPAKIINFIKTECKKEDVVIFEGKQASHALPSGLSAIFES